MIDVILILNAGSSSIKFSAYEEVGDALELVVHGQVEGLYTPAARFDALDRHGDHHAHPCGDDGPPDHRKGMEQIVGFLLEHREGHALVTVGHRVVHGGPRFARPVLITPQVLDELETFTPLAPLHQPHNLKAIRILAELQPGVPQVACFDTAFHHTQPAVARAVALPPEITDRGVCRYGFHGLSYAFIAQALPSVSPTAASGRTVVAHLGNGASMCAMVAGRSVASTMGFTALDGLPMGTRCGNLDPGVVLYLIQELGMDARAVEDLLYRHAGLLGVSGISSDMRALLVSDAPRARFAVDLYVHHIVCELGSLAAAMGGIDALVFTAGIGEHAASIREQVVRRAAWLGASLDADANQRGGPVISAASSALEVLVIPTNEEWMIARHTQALVE